MAGIKEYFDTVTYKPTYFLGDRVFGRHNGIPFVGYVYHDSDIHGNGQPSVLVDLYLPIKVDGEFVRRIKTTHENISALIPLEQMKDKKHDRIKMDKRRESQNSGV
jgi:hypothetical protein